MMIFAVIALLVGAFMIFNTFSITVQRTRENGLLRRRWAPASARSSAGCWPRRPRWASPPPSGWQRESPWPQAEHMPLGALGFGMPARHRVQHPHGHRGRGWPGLLVTLFAALSPGQAARVTPVAAMQEVPAGIRRTARSSGSLLAWPCSCSALAALFTGLFADVGNQVGWSFGAGALLGFFADGLVLGLDVAAAEPRGRRPTAALAASPAGSPGQPRATPSAPRPARPPS